jgi:hypothetical protein
LSAAVVREAIAADEVAVGAPGAGELDEVIREDFGLD